MILINLLCRESGKFVYTVTNLFFFFMRWIHAFTPKDYVQRTICDDMISFSPRVCTTVVEVISKAQLSGGPSVALGSS